MEKIDKLKNKISDFIERNKALSVAILAALALMLILIVIAVAMAVSGSKPRAPSRTPFSSEDEFIAPENNTLTEDYYFSRSAGDAWEKEEVDEWFTMPSESSMNQLRKDNEALVDEILGAAP
ncbi:MAG TPA: hypothetical protein DEO40_00070 [Treponema sp.]|jgi:hypothetical protein|nr:hypothetical protein [Treponema sp.]HBB42874.1 hypothetical protein [Treponema sp.]HCA19056.1 hypothetical protein [Treponema sp.]